MLAFLLAGCYSVETHFDSPQQSELAAIDTLMQSRPDSALTLLLDTTMEDPYYQLLLSEALYKNDYAQTNRKELLEAMAYYDSIENPFLSARCHYMNGVGYYEMDSVVLACQEYMKTLEIMEERFDEKALIGYKAKFMALTNTRLCVLFSDQFFSEQSIYFGKQALVRYFSYNASPLHIAWVMNKIAIDYALTKQIDSAFYYCDKTIGLLPDTNSMPYRDIMALRTVLSYNTANSSQRTLDLYYGLLSEAETKEEYLARCLAIGEFFYLKKQLDSAWYYLNTVYNNSTSLISKKLVAEYLVDICKTQGKESELIEYTSFLAPFANQEENKCSTKSQLTTLFQSYCQQKQERQHRQVIKERTIRITVVLVGLLFVILVLSFLYRRRNKMVGVLTNQIMEKQSLEKKKELFEQFLNETICQNIILSIDGKVIKRTTVPQDYHELILSDLQLQQLTLVVNRYFGPFENLLKQNGINPNTFLLNLCHLYLLGMDEKQAAILLNRDYSSIKRYEKKLKNGFKTQEDLRFYIKDFVINN